MRQPLHLSIEPLPYCKPQFSPDDSSESSSWSSVRPDSTTASSSTSSLLLAPRIIFSVLCLHDFTTHDPDQLSFRRNEILDVVTKEDNGWWAAMRRGGDRIGWIPMAFVQVLTVDVANRLLNVVEELRICEYFADQLYDSAPVAQLPNIFDIKCHTPPAHDLSQLALGAFSPQSPVRYNKPTPPLPGCDPASPRSPHPNLDSRILASIKVQQPQPQPDLPWSFLQPTYADQLKFDSEGHLRAGTLNALVERLTSESFVKDTLKMAEENQFRKIFLTTFRTFTKANVLFELLVERYRIQCPPDIVPSEFEEWKERKQLPTQRLVLTVFATWLEHHRLLEEEPYIAQRLTDFLNSITVPPYASLAAGIVRAIERITFSDPNATTNKLSSNSAPKPRRTKQHKNELTKIDPTDIARELCLIEHALYRKICPQECLNWVHRQTGKPVENLSAFLSMLEKLGAWVKMSVLRNETLSRRADTVDYWIKVAEKCRQMNNFSSMSAIINALSSTVIDRLHLTWAHVGRTSMLEGMLRHNDPTGGFAAYRGLIQGVVEGPCVPFVMMLLTDIMHISDQFTDEVLPSPSPPHPHPTSSATGTTTTTTMISWTKRQRWYDVISFMLKFQGRMYEWGEQTDTRIFILNMIKLGGTVDGNWFWKKSQEVQGSELAHADIRKGLERAGF